jgi:hypothetical protein
MSNFLDRDPTLENYWRSIILFGQNVASYKFALAKSLIELSGAGKTSITLEQLAEPFSRNIVEHLSKVRWGFQNVIDAFHVVNRDEIPVRFFQDDRKSSGGIILTDDFFRLRDRLQFGNLPQEVESRWRLVETAWQMKINRAALVVDVDNESLAILIAAPPARPGMMYADFSTG